MNAEVAAKRLGLFHELVPEASRYFKLIKPSSELAAPFVSDMQSDAASLGVHLEILKANTANQIDAAFASIPREPGCGVVFGPEGFFAELALARGLPTIVDVRDYVEAGRLASYGSDYLPLWS